MEQNLLVYGIGGVLIIVAYFFYNKFKKTHDLIQNTETSKITTLRKGFHEIKGKVVRQDNTLHSPLSNNECVYFKFKVEQEQSSGKNSSWRKIIDDEHWVPFYVEDSSGKAIINLNNAKLKLNIDVKEKSGTWDKATDEMERALVKYGRTSQGWIFEKRMRYRETFLEEGDEVYVLGEVVDFDGYYPIFRKDSLPYIVSDKSEEDLLRTYKLSFRACLFGIAAVAMGLIFYALYFPRPF